MAIESKNLLVWVKAMSRGQALPLDASEVYASLAEAQNYAATSAIAYPGQSIKALLEDGKYHNYTLQPSESGYVLEEVGAINESDLKQYVMVVETLPEAGQIEGVLYIKGTEGYVWSGTAWVKVFWDITSDVTTVSNKVKNIEEVELPKKAPLENPVFSGVVKVGEDEVALKSYVEGLFANLVSAEPGIVDSTHALPASYKAGQHFRVAEAGTYAGVKCEVGDLILVVKNYNAETASDDDFMVLQANVDGAVTSASEISTVGEVVVFDSVTGKVIKGSGIQIASLSEAMGKAHEHVNADQLATYDKTQAELLAAAKAEAEGLVNGLSGAVDGKLAEYAKKGTKLEDYGITDAYNTTVMDEKLRVITENLNSKVVAKDIDDKISEATPGILEQAAEAASDAIETRVGNIPADTTIQSYIDAAVGSGGTASATAIAAAKQEAIDAAKTYTDNQIIAAKSYTDTTLAAALTIVEF